MLTDFAEIWWLVCNLTSQCYCRISLKSDFVCQSYGNVYSVIVFSWTQCTCYCCVCTVQAVVNGRRNWQIYANSSLLPWWIVKTWQTAWIYTGSMLLDNYFIGSSVVLYWSLFATASIVTLLLFEASSLCTYSAHISMWTVIKAFGVYLDIAAMSHAYSVH